jgi:hypothetical protein
VASSGHPDPVTVTAAPALTSRRRVAVLTAVTLGLTVTALADLVTGGLGPHRLDRPVLWSCTVGAVLAAGVLLFALGGVRRRSLATVAGLVAALALLLPAVLVSQFDPASEANGFAGCGTFLRPEVITSTPGAAQECAVALRRQRTTTAWLAVPSAIVVVVSLLHAAGGLQRQSSSGSG